ncbi:protein-glutamine gamma-glutamyltransferase [Fictibacillus sp. WQ 8-8]|uniref:protein-glutamine gamma-glutamyltransferase n=1 Tax=Fictibacillus sp. WQ 8-8 TaxID=2938788 RepID=UPI00210DFB3F|nr:protein-glutamine gamma-glutamyltransferase [Fictibacillus sp. WQ 8-8]MCQ6264129.1 protein-glutamine gamma-glutamyltransferase [Fictibacillus sp. WQ 8-8]
MIYVKGTQLNSIEEIPGRGQFSEAQRGTALKLLNSRESFFYDNSRQLQFEITYRANIVSSAYALKDSGARFATFTTAKANRNFWILTAYGGFLLRPDVTPADAITDIFVQGRKYGFECTTAMMIILYKALLETIGPSTFNQLFKGLLLWSTEHDEDLQLTSVYQGDSLPGDIRYIQNPEFHPATPQWQGENLVDLGNGMFFGHGIGAGMLGEFIDVLNQRRRPGATTSAFLTRQIIRPNFRRMAEYTGHPLRRLLV